MSEVCVTLYSMSFQKPLGVKPSSNAINSVMGNGSFRATGPSKHAAQHEHGMYAYLDEKKTAHQYGCG